LDEDPQIISAGLGQIISVTDLLNTKGDKGYKMVTTEITKFLNALVQHSDPDTKELARVKLGEMAPKLSDEDRGINI
jgi:hypothetical protein